MALNMGKNKMCANDRAAAEMVIAFDELVLDELAQCFRLRALDHASEDSDTVWDEYGVTVFMKKVTPYIPRRLMAHCSITVPLQAILHCLDIQ